MKFTQLIEYNIRNILQQHVVEKLAPDLFYKKSKLIMSLDQQCEML